MNSYDILITAVGGDLGQAIVKSLCLSKKNITCHGTDADPKSTGRVFVKTFHVLPLSKDPDYLNCLDKLAVKLKVKAVIPGSEQEIFTLSQQGIPPKLPSGIPIVCHDFKFLEIFGDKLSCMKALSGVVNLVPFADGFSKKDIDNLIEKSGFPLVVKERRSCGSKGVVIVKSKQELNIALEQFSSPFIQAFIDDKDGEFTIGVFSDSVNNYFISFKRSLGKVGCSWRAELCNDKDVLSYAENITKHLKINGSINIQVRKNSCDVRLLEINPRFSSLAAARAACGFNDVEWSLDYIWGQAIAKPKIVSKMNFFRYFSELIDFGDGLSRVEKWDPACNFFKEK